MTRHLALFLFAAGGLSLLAGGGRAQDRFIKVYFPNGGAVTAELAVTEAQRARGLMNRTSVLPDQGMLFVFEQDGVHSFWMKNTLVALDILWLDRDHRIIHIERQVPPCPGDPCPSYGLGRPARYVLELKGGQAAAFGLNLQDRLDFQLPR
jgi:uncharacterized membrane protein (UPF0127 family)